MTTFLIILGALWLLVSLLFVIGACRVAGDADRQAADVARMLPIPLHPQPLIADPRPGNHDGEGRTEMGQSNPRSAA